MNSKPQDRWKKVLLNSSILTFLQVLTIILGFVNQTFFIQVLGKQFLGLNGLFKNLLTYLSFAELGIGTSIVFSLYKPLYNEDKLHISALMNFIRRAYTVIGIIVFVLGICLIPIFPYIIKDYGDIKYIQLYFIIYLSNSAVSYFYTYKRSILIADQKEYKSSLNIFKYTMIQTILQIVVLFIFKEYAIYLIVATICTFVSNVSISNLVNKEYPYLKHNLGEKLGNEELRHIKKNIVGMVGSRIGSIVVRSTDNLLLSAFIGLTIVGVYSNYLLIITGISTILSKLVSSVTASIGNLITEKNYEKSHFIFETHYYINLILSTITAACLLVSLNPFINAWVGESYVLTEDTVLIIVINYFIDQLRQSSIVFISAYGLFVPNGKKSVIEAVINFILSFTFLTIFNLGIKGVLLGTIVTNLVVNSWFEPFIIFKKGFYMGHTFLRFYLKTYLGNSILMIFFTGVFSVIINLIDSKINFSSLVIAFLNSIVMILLLGITVLFVFHNQKSVIYLKEKFISKVFSRKNE